MNYLSIIMMAVLGLLIAGCGTPVPTRPAVPTPATTAIEASPEAVRPTTTPPSESEEGGGNDLGTATPAAQASATPGVAPVLITASPQALESPVQPSEPPPPVYGGQTIEQAVADLAQRLGLATGEITVVSVTGDEFPADTLGCPPQKGNKPRPIPAFVTGQRILLEAQGTRHVYHAHGSRVLYCGLE